jgi:hypothetical protein
MALPSFLNKCEPPQASLPANLLATPATNRRNREQNTQL